MKINTIGTYILVYLLTCVLFNVLVSAKSTVDQTGYSSQPSETYPVYSQTSTPKTGVDLNISSDTKSTDEFDYKKVGQYVTYNPKENKAFKLVKDDNIQLWKATDPSEYCDKVEVDLMNNDAKAVTVCLGNENKVFMKTGNNELWNEFDISKVTRSAININYEHETYFYTNELVGNVRTFTAKKGFGFKGANEFINEKKVTIWMTNNKSEYANKIVNEKGDKLTIQIGQGAGATTKVYNKGSDGNWTEDKPEVGAELTLPTPQDKVTTTQPKVKLLKVNPSDPDSLMELDANEYTCTSNPSVALYQIDESVNCVKMMIDDAILWVYDSTYQGGIYPRSLEYHAVTDTFILRFEYHYIILENTDDGWISTESGPLDVKFHVADLNDPNNTVELTYDKITEQHLGYTAKFDIDNDVKCVKITYGPFLIWQHDSNKHRDKYPKTVYFNDTTEAFVLEFEGLDIRFTKNDQGGWDYTETDTSRTKRVIIQSVELDLQNKDPTNTYFCVDEDGFGKYIPRPGNRFSLVKGKPSLFTNSCTLIWESKEPTDLATAVFRDGTDLLKSMSYVTIFFGKNHRHFAKSDKMFVRDSDIRLYRNGKNPDKKIMLKNTQYTEDHSDDLFRFKFNDDTKCTEVKFVHRILGTGYSVTIDVEEVSVWQHDQSKHGDQYPKDLKYYWPDKILINFEHAFIVHTKNAEAEWDGHLFDFKLYVKDSNNLEELDATAYEITQDNEEYLFTFEDEVKLEEIKHNGKELWKHDPDKHRDKHPKFLSYATDKLALSYDESFEVYNKSADGKWEGGIIFEFKLYVKDSDNELKETGVTAYDLINQNSEHVFEFKGEHKCAMVKHKSYELWKHDHSKNDGKYPKTVCYTKTTGTFVLRFDGLDMTFAKNRKGKWECTETYTSDRGAGTVPSVSVSTTLPTPQDKVTTTQPKVKLLKVNPSDPDSLMELDANDYESITRGSVVLYKISSGVSCVQLIFDNVLLWTYYSSQYGGRYPKSVYHNTVTDTILLRFKGLHMTFEKNNQGQWVFTESGPLAIKLHIVDPNNLNNTVEIDSDQYTVAESGDITTFNIADGVNCSRLTYGPNIMWVYDCIQRPGNYPKSLYYIKSTDTLLLRFEGLDIAYAKNIEGVWEYTETDTSGIVSDTVSEFSYSSISEDERSYTIGESYGIKSVEGGPNTVSHLGSSAQVKLLKVNPSDPDSLMELGDNEYWFTTRGNVTRYEIARGVKCVQLIFDNVLLWEHDPNQRFGKYPESLYHDMITDALVLSFEGIDIGFEKTAEGQWIFTESGPLAVKFHVADNKDPNNTVELTDDQFTVAENRDITTFNIADCVNCIALTYGPVVLWEHDANKQSGNHPKSSYYIKSTDTLVLKI